MSDERSRISAELRRIRDGVRQRALLEKDGALPPPREAPKPAAIVQEALEEEALGPARPDATQVNDLWTAEPPEAPGGIRGLVSRILGGVHKEKIDAQKAFNARQVQLDNDLLDYIDARFHKTHTHYDRILGQYGRHLTEADERHMILQEELVAHVHDLVKRIDLVLDRSERGRLSLEFALRDVRERLQKLEALLPKE
jgi:hypothetical protein